MRLMRSFERVLSDPERRARCAMRGRFVEETLPARSGPSLYYYVQTTFAF
jgi:hypothetical protein